MTKEIKLTEEEWREKHHQDIYKFSMDFIQDEVGDIDGMKHEEYLTKIAGLASSDELDLYMEKHLFVEQAKRLEALGIFPEELLSRKGVIPKKHNYPPLQLIKDLGYSYDGEGNIRSIKQNRITRNIGTLDRTHGYVYININGLPPEYGSRSASDRKIGKKKNRMTIQKHLLVFALHHNRWCRDNMVIDHIDDDKTNNHHENLREITYKENNPYNKERERTIKSEPAYKDTTPLEQLFA